MNKRCRSTTSSLLHCQRNSLLRCLDCLSTGQPCGLQRESSFPLELERLLYLHSINTYHRALLAVLSRLCNLRLRSRGEFSCLYRTEQTCELFVRGNTRHESLRTEPMSARQSKEARDRGCHLSHSAVRLDAYGDGCRSALGWQICSFSSGVNAEKRRSLGHFAFSGE